MNFLQKSFNCLNIKSDKPTLIGTYSVDENRNYHHGMNNLKYLSIPREINFNLNEGEYFENIKYEPQQRIHQMTSFIMNNRDKVIRNSRIDSDFVCFSGALQRMMMARYRNEYHEPWKIAAIRFKETIYLCVVQTEERREKVAEQNELEDIIQRKYRQYGFKFESYILSSHPNREPSGKYARVIEDQDFCVVLKRNIHTNCRVLFGAEIDGVQSNRVLRSVNEIENASLVEVKTLRRPSSDEQEMKFFKHKALKWYCQSYLAGINDIHVGMRNDYGLVNEIRTVSIDELSIFAEQNRFWSKSVCHDFLKTFLMKIQSDLICDNPYIVFYYTWNPNVDVELIKLTRCEGDTFLSHDYINFVMSL